VGAGEENPPRAIFAWIVANRGNSGAPTDQARGFTLARATALSNHAHALGSTASACSSSAARPAAAFTHRQRSRSGDADRRASRAARRFAVDSVNPFSGIPRRRLMLRGGTDLF
jgi:hypothetical protein